MADSSIAATEQATDVKGPESSPGAASSSDVSAESSPATEGVKAPASPLEAVKAALEAPKDGEKADDKPTTDSPSRDADAKESKTSAAETAAEGEDQNFSKEANKRIRTLVSERNSARAELETVRQAADAYNTVVDRVKQTGASAEQVDQAVQMLYLINNDPARAFALLTPIYQQLETFVGNRLPDDLRGKVDGGYIDEESAKEIAALRARGSFTQQRHQNLVQQAEQASQNEQLNRLRSDIGQASSEWDSQWKGSDPDYQRKMPFVMAEMKARIAEVGGISSPQQALEIANASLKAVNDQLGSLLPKREEVKTVTGGFNNGNTTPKPRSPLEAARLALGR